MISRWWGVLLLFATSGLASGQVVKIDAGWLARKTAPYYLDRPNTTYVLQTDITTPGSAFGVIAKGVTLDLNQHSITFDQGPPLTVAEGSFETDNGWTLPANASFFRGDYLKNTVYEGARSLRFVTPCPDQAAEWQGTLALEAGVTYDLTAMVWKKNVDCTLYVEIVGPQTFRKSYSGANNRGIQLVSDGGSKPNLFTPSAKGTYRLRVGIAGAAAAAAGAVYIDDVKIQQTRTCGVAVGIAASAQSDYPGFSRAGRAANCTIKNGRIRQGDDGATFARAVITKNSDALRMENVTLEVHGANSNCLNAASGSGHNVQRCSFVSRVRTISDRDNAFGSVVKGFSGEFAYNEIDGGPCQGLELSDGKLVNLIHHNRIRIKGTYTNCYAIYPRGVSDVYENDIECHEGEYAGRGIMVRTNTGTHLHHNRIQCRLLANNQEYGGAAMGGCYGIQCENAGDNADIHDNQITVYAEDVPAFCLRTTWGDTTVLPQGVKIHDNTLTAISRRAKAACLKLGGPQSGCNEIVDCTLRFNDLLIGESHKVPGVTLVRPKFERLPQPTDRIYHESTGRVTQVHIIAQAAEYLNPEARAFLQAATWRRDGGPADPDSSWLNRE